VRRAMRYSTLLRSEFVRKLELGGLGLAQVPAALEDAFDALAGRAPADGIGILKKCVQCRGAFHRVTMFDNSKSTRVSDGPNVGGHRFQVYGR
jgi:hypothetical protein